MISLFKHLAGELSLQDSVSILGLGSVLGSSFDRSVGPVSRRCVVVFFGFRVVLKRLISDVPTAKHATLKILVLAALRVKVLRLYLRWCVYRLRPRIPPIYILSHQCSIFFEVTHCVLVYSISVEFFRNFPLGRHVVNRGRLMEILHRAAIRDQGIPARLGILQGLIIGAEEGLTAGVMFAE